MVRDVKRIMGFWTDCINPLGKHNHGFWSHGQPCSFAKVCDGCWYRLGHKEPTYIPIPLKKDRNSFSIFGSADVLRDDIILNTSFEHKICGYNDSSEFFDKPPLFVFFKTRTCSNY